MTLPLAPLQISEDGGLGTLMGTASATLAREAALNEPAILQAARDVLQSAFADDRRQRFLDPFAPAGERNAEVVAVLRAAIAEQRQHGGALARVPADDATLIALFAATLGWGPAQRYLDDERVNEVKIVGRHIRVQEAGQPFVTAPEAFRTTDEVYARAILLAAVLGVRLDAEIPQATLPVAHGTRMHVSIPPRTVAGALVCIRRGRREAWDLGDVLARGTLGTAVVELLTLFSRARCAMLIAGRTGSGKTGLLEALANSWPGDPHTLTIEDHTMEIGIRRDEVWTRELVDTQRDPLAFSRVAREALGQAPDRFTAMVADAATQYAGLEQHVQAMRWAAAREAYTTLIADLGRAAAAVPPGGWEALDARIAAGLRLEDDATATCADAATALRQGHPQLAVELLTRFTVAELPRQIALPLIRVREQALQALRDRGEGSVEALATVRAQRQALEQAAEQGYPLAEAGQANQPDGHLQCDTE